MRDAVNKRPSIEEVRAFWNDAPLFTGESNFEPRSLEFFEEHKRIYNEDVFAGKFDDSKFIPQELNAGRVLDLGCGVGFWTVEIQQRRDCTSFYSGDLTEQALEITARRLEIYSLSSELSVQNAEELTYEDAYFGHVNCQGVIHHTPDAERAVAEIARVTKGGGTASISVYYKNVFLRQWPHIRKIGTLLHKLGGGLKGRGRESIFSLEDPQEIVRHYDGADNPIGKAYSKQEFHAMLSPYFEIEESQVYFFPARSLPFGIPKIVHRWFSNHHGFMINCILRRKS